MNTEWTFQSTCLAPFLQLFQSNGIPSAILDPTAEFPFATLGVKLEGIGKSRQDVSFELTLPPGTSDIEGGTYLLLMNGTLAKDVKPNAVQPLLWMVNKLNSRLGLGAFVMLEQERQLMFRQSIILGRLIPVELQVKLVDQQFGLILRQLDVFLDALKEVAAGRQSPEDALRAHPMGHLFSVGAASNS